LTSENDLDETDNLAFDGDFAADVCSVSARGDNTLDHITPADDNDFEDADVPVTQSLESRIEAILSQSADCAVPFLSPRSASPTHSTVPPPLPVDDGFPGPPLPYPPDDSPPIIDSQPPLPPPADDWPFPPADGPEVDSFAYREVADNLRIGDRIVAMNGCSGEDDCMSMSSLSSGEEKLEVNVPASAGLGDGQWPLPSSLVTNVAYLTDKLNQLNEMKSMMEPVPESLTRFDTILDQVIKDLRQVMCRDVRKKMIENTGFKSFERWCDDKVQRHKVHV